MWHLDVGSGSLMCYMRGAARGPMDRRSFLIGVGGAAGALTVPVRARAADAWHVHYLGATTAAEAAELLQRVATCLGPDVAADLVIARRGDDHLVLYDRSSLRHAGDRDRALDVAATHAKLLAAMYDEEGPLTDVVGGDALQQTWNIRYGEPGSLDAQRARYALVGKMLGAGVAKALAVEELPDGAHQLVYRRGGDRDRTDEVALHHTKLLRKHRILATAVPDQFAVVKLDGSTVGALHDDDDDDVEVAEAPAAPERRATTAVEHDDTAAVADTGTPDDTALDEVPELAPVDEVVEVVAKPTRVAPLQERAPALPDPTPVPKPVDVDLSAAINDHVQKLRRMGRVDRVERTAWIVHDLQTDETLAAINGERPMQAASMIKPFVALAFFDEVARGRLHYGPKSSSHMVRMIRDSSNTSTNWLMQAVGGPRSCQRILDKRWGEICQHVQLVEYIPAGGRTYLNRAAAMDHARLLRALWHEELPSSRELRRVMNLPGPDRLYHDVPEIPAGTEVYNKTGTTAMCCGDMGILVARTQSGQKVPYIVVGVIERAQRTTSYTAWSRARGDVIRGVSALAYGAMKARYDLR